MPLDLSDVNLLEMRRSERKQLASRLLAAPQSEMITLSQKIENTLSTFANVHPENEEQLYLFGAGMRSLVESLNGQRSIPPFRDHPEKDIRIVFGGGFLGLSFKETLAQLEADRKIRRKEYKAKVAENKTRRIEARVTLVEEIKEVVAGLVPTAGSFDR
jgi:hypothetical protein